jgi:hypothetical protein
MTHHRFALIVFGLKAAAARFPRKFARLELVEMRTGTPNL